MNLLTIGLRNVRTRILSSALTTVSVAVGTGLVAALWLMIAETEDRYTASLSGYDAIVGPKEGSPLNLVLNTVLNLGAEPGLVPMSVYREFHEGALARRLGVRYAIPQARGDTYGGFPIIGTTSEMFTEFARGKDHNGEPRHLQFAQGSGWSFDHAAFLAYAEHAREHAEDATHAGEHDDSDLLPEPWREAVIGADVARTLDLRIGSEIVPVHGRQDEVAHQHTDAASRVVGILARTGTPIDRAIYVPISLFLSMSGHESVRPQRSADGADDVWISAIVVDARHPLAGAKLRAEFQTREDAQVAWPQFEIPKLLQIVGNVSAILAVIARLVVVVAAIGVCVALYNTMNERRREIAIMRSLGARRWQILSIILSEAVLVSLVGAVVGVLLCHGAAWALADRIADETSVQLDWAAFSIDELWLIVAVAALGAVAGAIPAVKGSLTQVADNLGPVS